MFSPEEQRIIDERWKQYDTEWKQPQTMSRDQTALEIEKFRYETEARYREDQLRQTWKRCNEPLIPTPVTFRECQMYHELGVETPEDESPSRARSNTQSDSFGWFLTGCFCTLILLYILN